MLWLDQPLWRDSKRFALVVALLVALAACAQLPLPSGPGSSLTIAVSGQPPFPAIGGNRIEASLERPGGAPVGTWQPGARATVAVAPGDYVLVLVSIGSSDAITCDGRALPDDRNCHRDSFPPFEICRAALTIPPATAVSHRYSLAEGPMCREEVA